MGGLRKTAHKIVGKTAQVLDPIQYKLYGKEGMERVSDWTSKNVWQDPVVPAALTDAATVQTIMPTPDDTELAKARRKRISAQRSRSGRLSTVLTNTDALGG